MCFSGTEEHLKTKYIRSLSRLEPIPGEEFSVSLDDSKLFMTAKFKSWEIDLESEKNKDMIRYKQKLDTDKADYKHLNISELGNVFNSVGDIEMNASNLQSKLITLIGDPGVGKTTAAQKLAWDWASEKCYISQRFKLVFFVPVKLVRDNSLMDVLASLKLTPDPLSDGIQNLDHISKHTLFILDGADENDLTGDLYRLITGELYPESTVLLTARPEAKCFKSFPVLPRVKVNLLGTDDDTVDRYMREASSDEEWKSFQDNYKGKLSDTALLNIPLYLSILCALFKDHIVRDLNLKIPQSSTQLFNAFLHVLIIRWLARTNRKENVNFEKSPIDPNSTIPGDIKIALYFIGKLCYKDLIQATSNYQFTDTEARECLLDMQIIKDCGLFNVGKSGKHEMFYPKHKQFQEYLAALYLSYEGTKEQSFHELLYTEENKNQPLFNVMHNIKAVRLVQFACGLSGQFLKSLLNIATSQFCLSFSRFNQKTPSQNFVDIYYESLLFTEHHTGDLSAYKPDELHGFSELKKYLVDTKLCLIDKRSYECIPVFEVKSLRTLCGLFDKPLSLQLLSQFYNINMKPVGGEQSVNYEIEGHSGSEICLSLNQLQTELLNVVCIHSVQCVRSHGVNVFVDIPSLLQTFPHLSELDVSCGIYIPYSSKLRSDRDTGTSVTHVRLHGVMHAILPESHAHTLLLQTNLSHLTLDNISMPLVLTCTTQPVWSQLQRLTWSDPCKSNDEEGMGMCRLLQSSRHSLTHCHLCIKVVVNALPLIEEGLKSQTRVEDLRLHLYVHGEPYNLRDTLQRVLPHLTTLKTLRVDYSAVCDTLDRFVDTMCEHINIRRLWFDGSYNRQLPQQCKDKLTRCGVEVIKE